jgi:hypothetical protein
MAGVGNGNGMKWRWRKRGNGVTGNNIWRNETEISRKPWYLAESGWREEGGSFSRRRAGAENGALSMAWHLQRSRNGVKSEATTNITPSQYQRK